MSISELTLLANNSYPTCSDNAPAFASGGGWPEGTYSFVVVAWFDEDEVNTDQAGIMRPVAGNWINVPNGVANAKVTVTWTKATRTPKHYSIYFQSGASIDLSTYVIKIGEASRNSTSCICLYPDTSRGTATSDNPAGVELTDITDGTFETDGVVAWDYVVNIGDNDSRAAIKTVPSESKITHYVLQGGDNNDWEIGDDYVIQTIKTFGADPTSIVMDLIEGFDPIIREFTAEGYNGLPVRKSQASEAEVKALNITINHTSLGRDDYNTILQWIGDSTDIKIEDGDTGAKIQSYYGRFLKTDYLGSWSKGSLLQYKLHFLVYRTSEE